ncbi:MAG: hypothetical protein KAI74_02675 [Kiritimatiellae bacterium]|nr:hypothetical protein [Kiritimatiellia bacterium]
MSDLLFKCSECKRNLAVNTSLLGRRFVCPQCQEKIQAPDPEIIFSCPECGSKLCSALTLASKTFECPKCEKNITIPKSSIVTCQACDEQIKLSADDYATLAGKNIECPKCTKTVNVPCMPGMDKKERKKKSGLPAGFGNKTMRLDDLISISEPIKKLNAKKCPYCESDVNILQDNSYICTKCERIMRVGANFN